MKNGGSKPSEATLPARSAQFRMNEESSPEWSHAVRNAAAHLNEGWILPETKCHPAVAEELAAFMCAYGV